MTGIAQELGDLLQPVSKPMFPRRCALAALAGGALVVAGLGWWLTRGSAPERSLTLSIIAQRMKDGAAVSEPYVASLSETFESGWRFRLRAQSPQAGYFYVVSDGPDDAGVNRLWMLSKLPLSANQTAETGWNVFDSNPGTERLWIVWAQEPVDLLSVAGRVDNPDLEHKIRDMLAGWKPVSATSNLQLRGAGAVLGGLLQLQHR